MRALHIKDFFHTMRTIGTGLVFAWVMHGPCDTVGA